MAALGCQSGDPAPAPPSDGESRSRVILLLLDAARPDRFSSYGYPRATTPEIDRLAERGVVFENHYAQGTGTRESVPALLFSRYFSIPIFPNDPQVPYSRPDDLFRRPDDEQISLPKAFEQAGYLTAAISAHMWTGRETPFAAEFAEMHDLTDGHRNRWYPYPRAEAVVDATIDWLRENHDRDFFLYVHLMDTHYPHYFEYEAQAFFGADAYGAERFRKGGGPVVRGELLTEDDRRYIDALYDGSLRYTDREIGRLAEFLQEAGWLDDTILAITADHGEHLLDGPDGGPRANTTVFSHGGPWLDPVARIPLIILGPGKLEPGTFSGLSEGVDVAPTLAALAGVELPADKSFDGVDLAEVVTGRVAAKEQVVTRGGNIRTATYKGISISQDRAHLSASRGGEMPGPRRNGRVYDLIADPGEQNDLMEEQPEVAIELLKSYRSLMASSYQRAQANRTDEPPTAAFAISARHARTNERLPRVEDTTVPRGWSRLNTETHSALIARSTAEPLAVRFPVPDGRYLLNLGLVGQLEVEVGDRRLALDSEEVVKFGDIEVTGGRFEATLYPQPENLPRILFFGFVPEGVTPDPEVDEERLQKLKALGYVQ